MIAEINSRLGYYYIDTDKLTRAEKTAIRNHSGWIKVFNDKSMDDIYAGMVWAGCIESINIEDGNEKQFINWVERFTS